MNVLAAGQKILYRPVDIPSDDRKKAEVALVLLPAGEVTEHTKITVLKPKPANEATEWDVPIRTGAVAVVYGPQGLETGKVTSLVEKDREMVLQLADYTEKTQATEALISALTLQNSEPNAKENLNTAMSAFAAQYGATPGKLDRTASGDQQALAMLKALNPSLSSYDPLATQTSVRMQQSASLAAAVGGLFLGNTVGLAAGGASVLVSMRNMMFPNTEFRSALAQPTKDETMSLCAKRDTKSHTRIAFLWALRVPDQAAPKLELAGPTHVPLALKSPIAVKRVAPEEWKVVDRAHAWRLEPINSNAAAAPVTVHTASDGTLELDLTRATLPSGAYRLGADWDWTPFRVGGEISVHTIPDLTSAKLTPASQDRLVEGAAPLTVDLAGADFQFVEKVELRKAAERRSTPTTLTYDLAQGRRGGVQPHLSVDLNPRTMERGDYSLLVTQADGKRQEVPLRVLPPNPQLTNTPLRVNVGEKEQTVTLQGSGLERITHLAADGAQIDLRDGARAVVRLGSAAHAGQKLDLALTVAGRESPLVVKDAILVAGPRPRITQVQPSLPAELTVALAKDELPAGYAASFAMRLAKAVNEPRIDVACAEPRETLTPLTLRPGEQRGTARLGSAGNGMLFLSLDAGEVGQAGCQLQAVVESSTEGRSDAVPLGRVVRLPRIDTLEVSGDKVDDTSYAATLKGQDLETVEQAGWDPSHGLPVRGLPAPVAGDAHRQVLSIAVPWPPPAPRAPLYVWLRGEAQGRPTTARY